MVSSTIPTVSTTYKMDYIGVRGAGVSNYVAFSFLFSASLLLCRNPLRATFIQALDSESYTHILLILPVSVALVVPLLRRREWQARFDVGIGAALLAVACLLGGAGAKLTIGNAAPAGVALCVEMAGVVTCWVALFIGCFGRSAFRRGMFPLLFLAWLIPVPDYFLTNIVLVLQQGTAWVAHVLLILTGIPVVREANTLKLPGMSLEIARECSSIRSSTMLLISSMVIAQVLLRSIVGKTIVSVAAVPLAILKNGVRVFTLGVLGAYISPGILNGPVHHQGGVFFLTLSLIAVFGMVKYLAPIEQRKMWP